MEKQTADSVPHQRGMWSALNTLLSHCLTCRSQSVVIIAIDGSVWGPPGDSTWPPIIFNVHQWVRRILYLKKCLFAVTIIYRTTQSINYVANLQSDLIALEKWQVRFNPGKCQITRIPQNQNPVVFGFGKNARFGHPLPLSRHGTIDKPRLEPTHN